MKLIFKSFMLLLLLLVIGVPGAVFLFGLDDTPKVVQTAKLSYDNIARAKQIINTNRPRQIYMTPHKNLDLSEDEINLLICYAIEHGLNSKDLSCRVKIMDTSAQSDITYRMPDGSFKPYLNLSLRFEEKGRLIEPVWCRIGRIKIPELITRPVVSAVHNILMKHEQYQTAFSHIEQVDKISFFPERLSVQYRLTYHTVEEIKNTGRAIFLKKEQQLKLIQYYNRLAELSVQYQHEQNAFIPLLKGIIRFSQENTQKGLDPVIENTAALQAFSLYASGFRISDVVDKSLKNRIKRGARTRMTFHGRSDLPKHFIISCALTVSAGDKFAGLIGIAKEVDDSKGGSGFSFADLAADRAGVLFGTKAVDNRTAAADFQKNVLSIRDETDIMPSIQHLPEGIMELEFKKTYKDLDSRAYRIINAEIDQRLSQCRFYKL